LFAIKIGIHAMARTSKDHWRKNYELVKEYFSHAPLYDALCEEVAFYLNHLIRVAGIKVSSITKRVKTLDSVLEKVERKQYLRPLQEMTDLAGVRVVCLYLEDLSRLEEIISQNFLVLEETDKGHEEEDRFGYSSFHYLVKLGRTVSGARYEDIRDLVCEIQIRTILQNAWAEVAHHLLYKKESEIPKPLRRRIHSLSALLENADQQFTDIATSRREYVDELSKKGLATKELLDEGLNRDSLRAFLAKKFPTLNFSMGDSHANLVIGNINLSRYRTIGDIDRLLQKTEAAWSKYKSNNFARSALAYLAIALGCEDDKFRKSVFFEREASELIVDYRRALGKPSVIGDG